eukprot:6310676-Amphidinium_carterae.1
MLLRHYSQGWNHLLELNNYKKTSKKGILLMLRLVHGRHNKRKPKYENDDDGGSQATDMSFEQWQERNADALNDDEFGFGFEDDRDIEELFDESGLQPDQD